MAKVSNKCPKCNWRLHCKYREVLARKQNGDPVLIRLVKVYCVNKNCVYADMESYDDKIRLLKLKRY